MRRDVRIRLEDHDSETTQVAHIELPLETSGSCGILHHSVWQSFDLMASWGRILVIWSLVEAQIRDFFRKDLLTAIGRVHLKGVTAPLMEFLR